ncbi:MAG: V-type ATPase 116kDa subunit family protein [Gammaproteobacteria bacterium]|nr:V-type ATPase 116kDa subunit family protein [Gammaproteobacteria bacterium]
MRMRPDHTLWFELLVTHDDLTDTLEALAHTGSIELELHEHTHMQMDLQDLQLRLQEFSRLERYYKSLWPKPDAGMSPFSGSPADIFDKALSCIYDWEKEVQPQIQRLDIVKNRLNDLRLLQKLLTTEQSNGLDYRLLSASGANISARLFLQPHNSRLQSIPDTVLWKEYKTATHQFLLLVGTVDDLNALSAELIQKKYTYVQLPSLPASREDALHMVCGKQAQFKSYMSHLQVVIDSLAKKFHLAHALGEIRKMDWFLKSVPTLQVTDNFAWITGWTSDRGGSKLHKALTLQGSHAILHFPDAPENLPPPLLLQNPRWAKPFEIFARMLGTPGTKEADPSRILAIMAPLLFGYMFGDVGQGFVLLMCGVLLQKRWPFLRILIANGASAMAFGFVFGSIFGREDLIPALWLHPITQPLPVLAVSLLAGIFIILLGLMLSALESSWRGEWQRWLQVDAAVMLLYLAIILLFFIPEPATVAIVGALVWYLMGNFMLAEGKPLAGKLLAVLTAIGALLETMMQLFLNTVSFVRVGAFALAHAGLSMAFSIMADSADSILVALLLMLLGNIIVIVLEGLVVSIQTTRLILFEFFIRFLQANGRVFKPLAGPVAEVMNS